MFVGAPFGPWMRTIQLQAVRPPDIPLVQHSQTSDLEDHTPSVRDDLEVRRTQPVVAAKGCEVKWSALLETFQEF